MDSRLIAKIEQLALADQVICPRSLWPTGESAHKVVLDAWRAGREGRVPASLLVFKTRALAELDPEYSEFQRLARKFS